MSLTTRKDIRTVVVREACTGFTAISEFDFECPEDFHSWLGSEIELALVRCAEPRIVVVPLILDQPAFNRLVIKDLQSHQEMPVC